MKKSIAVLALTLAMLMGASALASNFYLVPDSDRRRMTEEECWEWSYDALGYVFNEIFARHGYHFEPGGKYESYFLAQSWYHENERYATNQEIYNHLMSAADWYNEGLIKRVRQQMRDMGTKNPGGKGLPAVAFEPEIPGAFAGFEPFDVKSNLKLACYSGPGKEYWRGANGKASASTNGDVYAYGWEDGWLMIMYWTNNGSVRVGFASSNDLKGAGRDLPMLRFAYADATITGRCTLTDDPACTGTSMRRMKEGEHVTYLGAFVNDMRWAYIETNVDGQIARGFVPHDCVDAGDAEEDDGADSDNG